MSENQAETQENTPQEEVKEDWKAKYMYAVAENQNSQKRWQKEKEEIQKFSNEKLIKEILYQMDGFNEGLKFITDEASRQGVFYILSNLEKGLEKFGLKKIESGVGQEFSPHIHEAVGVKAESNQADNVVLETLQVGYTLSERVLRPSKVIVNKL